MDIKEIRVGNYVKYNGSVVSVYAISNPTPNKDKHFDNKARVTLWCNGLIDATIDEIEPIPITDELLLKNGFTDNGKGQFHYHLKDKYKTIIRCATDDYKNWLILVDSMRYHNFISTDVSNHNVQHIHELQNVIQIAKVDKEIKL